MTIQVEVSVESGVPGLDAAAVEGVVERAVRAVLADRDVAAAELSVTLLDDAAMAALNREWKGHDTATDVLAFALHEEDAPPLGDLYLGADRVGEQAAAAGEPVGRELARLAVHGTLHVLGWDHPEQGREGSEMWAHQERILAGLDPS
jgi:probable rRNA maturation factor